jgi:hypothetical protein
MLYTQLMRSIGELKHGIPALGATFLYSREVFLYNPRCVAASVQQDRRWRLYIIRHWDFVIDSSFWFLNSSLLSTVGWHALRVAYAKHK